MRGKTTVTAVNCLVNRMQLVHSILRTFNDVPAPRAGAIGMFERGYKTQEAKNVEEFFAEWRWQEMNLQLLSKYRGDRTACLTFMSREGFRYFYPAFLLMCLDDVLDDYELLVPTARFLDRQFANSNFHVSAVESYTPEQKCCIAEWLLAVSGRYEVLYRHESPEASLIQVYDGQWRDYLLNSSLPID